MLITLVALSAAVLYAFYGQMIQKEVRAVLETELSKTFDGIARIESVGYAPPFSVAINNIEVSPNDPKDENTYIDRIKITIDPFTLIRDRRLTAILDIQRLRKGDMVLYTQIKAISRRAADYRELLNSDMMESVCILNAELGIGRFKIKDILGTLDISKSKVSSGKVDFIYHKDHYFVIFKATDESAKRYDLSFRAKNLGINCRITKEPGTALIENFKGMFYTLKFDLSGELKNPTSSKSQLTMNGTVYTNLEGVSSLPEGLGKFGREHRLSGTLRSTLYIKAAEPDISMLELNGTLFAEHLKIDQMKIEEITTKWTVKNGRFNAPLVNITLYGGRLTGRLTVDIWESYLPYRSELKLLYMDFGALIYDASKKSTSVYGTMDMDISVAGLALKPDSVDGFGSMKIYNAGLGPMPIVTPLLGSIYSSIETCFPEKYKVNINYVNAGFEIKDRRISTSNLTFGGKTFFVKSEGYLDFDGGIDFRLQNELRDPPADEFSGWQISLRNAITRFGHNLGKARVRGTLNDPKWDFEFSSPE